MYLSGIDNKTSIRQQHRATHDASKSATTPVRFLSLLPCPADHRSSTLKSVHWNCSEPILPEQPVPLRQISSAAGPIKFPSDTVLLSQGADPLSQAIRWMNRTYIYKRRTYTSCMLDYTRTICYIRTYQENVEVRYVAIPKPIASYRKAEVQTLTLPSKLSGSTGLHWMMAPLK